MANNPYVNKVQFGNQTVMDISDTDAQESDVANGKTFYKGTGQRSTGTANIDGAIWGNITGDIDDQTDLQNELAKKVITLTKAQYDALPSADKLDPDKVYYVTDYDPVPVYAELDDSATAADKVWSSQKVNTELGDKYDVDDGEVTALSDADTFPLYKNSDSAKKKITWLNIKNVLHLSFPLIRVVGTNESGTTASKAYAKGDYFYKDLYFCYAKTDIASGATLTRNTNFVRTSIGDEMNQEIGKSYTESAFPQNVAGSISISNLPKGKYIGFISVKAQTGTANAGGKLVKAGIGNHYPDAVWEDDIFSYLVPLDESNNVVDYTKQFIYTLSSNGALTCNYSTNIYKITLTVVRIKA